MSVPNRPVPRPYARVVGVASAAMALSIVLALAGQGLTALHVRADDHGSAHTASTARQSQARAQQTQPAQNQPPAPSQAVAPPGPVPLTPPPAPGTPLDVATRLGDAFADVASRVSPAVVNIRVESRRPQQQGFGGFGGGQGGFPFPFGFGGGGGDPFGGRGGGEGGLVQGQGSGVIISADGNILTNRHVIEDAQRIEVLLKDGRRLHGTVVGADEATDLAVVRVSARGLPFATFADSDVARPGEWVVAVGSPFGLEYTVTAGVLSAVGRGGLGQNQIEDYLQTDASINPGNSGGPLLNLRGEVLGINTMIIGRGTGIGFAIPANLARSAADQLIATGQVRRSWIGVGFQELTPELASNFGAANRRGALVNQIVPNGPAARGGVRPGDIVVSVNGHPIEDSRELLRAVLRQPVGAGVALGLVRGGREQAITVVTATRPSQNDQNDLPGFPGRPRPQPNVQPSRDFGQGMGLQMQSLTPNIARQANYNGNGQVVVVGVLEGSPADHAGLRPGDVIVEADQREVRRADDVTGAMRDGRAVLRVERQDGSFYAVVDRD